MTRIRLSSPSQIYQATRISSTYARGYSKMTSASAAQPNTLTAPEPTVVNRSHHEFDKTLFDSLLSRRFFFAPAFEIYGGG
jgi:hypothetical protein